MQEIAIPIPVSLIDKLGLRGKGPQAAGTIIEERITGVRWNIRPRVRLTGWTQKEPKSEEVSAILPRPLIDSLRRSAFAVRRSEANYLVALLGKSVKQKREIRNPFKTHIRMPSKY